MTRRWVWVVVLFLAATGAAFAQSTAPKPSSAMSPTHVSAQFATEQAAKSHCPGDTVVWATLSRAKVYHASGDRYYGKTKRGAYMCQRDAAKAGMHQARLRTRSSTAGKSTSPGTSTSTSPGTSPSGASH